MLRNVCRSSSVVRVARNHKLLSQSARCLTNTTLNINHAIISSKCVKVHAQPLRDQRRFASGSLPSHIKVPLPALSPTMEMGTIISWEKKEGDHLSEGDLLAEIETDKATMGFETPEEGYLAKILLPAGSKNVPLGKLLCIIVENEADIAAFKDYVDSSETVAAAPSTPAPSAAAPLSAPSIAPAPVKPVVAPVTARSTNPGDRIFISPLAKQIALSSGLDMSQVQGSGPNGRIRAIDLQSAPAVSTSTASSSLATDIPLTSTRSTIAKRLLQSKQTIPHYYLTVEIEIDQLVKLREQMNKKLEKEKVKLSLNDFVIKAAALACKQVPEVNSSWQETFIRQYTNVDVSLAVSTDNGLITPIVFNANDLGVKDISQKVKQLATKARDGKLQPSEYQGGTFTISNLGMFGVGKFSAVINPPQSCILAVGSVEKRVVVDKVNDVDQFKVANLLSVTLSCDHRVVDGAVGAKWLQHFTQYMNEPFTMVL